jgi:1,2-diacylglycerol 3-beta-galactosyltransferase
LRRKIDLIYIDSGGGHRAAATALAEVIREQQRPWDIRLLSIQEMLNSIDFIRKSTGIPFQDLYNIMLRRGWTIGTAQLIPLSHQVIRAAHKAQVRVLARHWSGDGPDVVVSLIPHYNRALREALAHTCPGVPYVTVLTDIADYPPHFWIEQQDQYVICGSERAAEQARAIGLPKSRILRTSGMILSPKFYEPLHLDRKAERKRLGLKPDRPTGLVLFGGEGSTGMLKIAQLLNRADAGIQLILICGRNKEAAQELRALKQRIPMLIEGFTPRIPYYMELSDFFIGKPGPGSISEALAKHLPVIVERNVWTLAHERYNTTWIEEQGVGMVLKSFSEIFEAVQRLLAPENYNRLRRRAAAIKNRAVYEIPLLLDEILSEPQGALQPAYAGTTKKPG